MKPTPLKPDADRDSKFSSDSGAAGSARTPNADMQAEDAGSADAGGSDTGQTDAGSGGTGSSDSGDGGDGGGDSATAATRAMKQTSKTAAESVGKR